MRSHVRCFAMVVAMMLAAGVASSAGDFAVCTFDGVGKVDPMQKTTLTVVTQHATEGRHAMKMESPGGKIWPGVYVYGFPKDWSNVKYLAVDVFNPGKRNVELSGWIKDNPKGGFYGRYNYRGLIAKPGKSTLRVWLANARKGNAFPLNVKTIHGFCMGPYEGQPACTLYIDNLRLEPLTAEKLPDVLLILDFEEGSKAGKYEIEDWPATKPGKSVVALSTEHVTEGKRSLKFTFRKEGGGNLQVYGFTPDWTQHDVLVFDCTNTSDEVIEMMGWFRDAPMASYYNRYNYSGLMVMPGKSQVRIPLAGLLKGESAGSGPTREALNRTNIVRFNIGTSPRKQPVTIYFDHFRLEKSTLARFEGPRVRKFDFGANVALAFPGFTPVNQHTAYDPAYGYGWKGKPAAVVQCGSYEYPDDLLSDFVPGHEFIVDMPNGKYRVVFFAESANYWDAIRAYRNRKVVAEGKTVIDDKWTGKRYWKERFFRHAFTEDLPGDDHWEKYVKPRWTPHTFDVTVTDGQLNVQFSDPKNYNSYPSLDWPLNCMIIYPVAQSARADAWMKKLNAEQRRLFKLMYNEIRRGPKPVKAVPAYAAKGDYVVFVPSYFKDVYPQTVPTEAETQARRIELRATPGETEPAAVGVFPNRDLGRVTVTVSGLRSTPGKVIPADALTAHRVRYKIKRRSTGLRYIYSVIPRMVDPVNHADVKRGVTRTFHVLVRVPADAAAGVYTGKVTVTPERGKPTTLPLRLEVLPFKLVEDRDFDLAFFGVGVGFAGYPDVREAGAAARLRNLKNLRDHGMTTTWGPGHASYYRGKLKMDAVERFVKQYHDAGFDGNYFVAYGSGQIYGTKTREQLVDAYTQYCRRLAELGRTKLMLSLADEPSRSRESGAHEHVSVTIARLKKYQGIPGLMTSGYYSHLEELIPLMEVSILGQHDAEFIRKVKAAGKRCWTYGAGPCRFRFGFYAAKLKRAGVEGTVAWHYQIAQGDVYNSLDGREEDHSMAFPLPDGVINDVAFDRVREGADDFRYTTTLRKLIAERKGTPAARRAQALVDEILSRITLGRSSMFTDLDVDETNRKCAEYRTKIIEAILSLKK